MTKLSAWLPLLKRILADNPGKAFRFACSSEAEAAEVRAQLTEVEQSRVSFVIPGKVIPDGADLSRRLAENVMALRHPLYEQHAAEERRMTDADDLGFKALPPEGAAHRTPAGLISDLAFQLEAQRWEGEAWTIRQLGDGEIGQCGPHVEIYTSRGFWADKVSRFVTLGPMDVAAEVADAYAELRQKGPPC